MALAGDPRGYYRALAVERTASADDLKLAFRRRAKALHPDQGGAAADRESFRLLIEAYEALRDPQQRLRYDTESLAAERGDFDRGWAHGPADGAWTAPSDENPDGHHAGPGKLLDLASGYAMPLLTLGLVAALALAVVGWSRAAERGRTIAELDHRLEVAAAQPRALPDGADLPRLYRTELRFPAGVAELDKAAQERLARVVAELLRQSTALPSGSEWLVGVEGAIDRAADGDGLLVAAWEQALLRVGVTAQYLVAHGIPAERVAVRFHAGAMAPGQDRGQPQAVALSLFCCLDAPLGG